MSAASHRLRRVLGLRDLIVVAAAAMGPAFSLATTMAAMIAAAGRWTWLALVIVTVLMAMVAIGYRRLGEKIGDAGSSYTWIRAAFGPEAGAYGAWVLLVANFFALAATAIPAATYTLDLVAPALAASPLAVAIVASLWTLASAVVLWIGLRPTATLAFGLLAAEIVILAAAAFVSSAHPRPDAVAFTNLPLQWTGLLGAIIVGIWMIDGWEVSASTAEEAQGTPSSPGIGGLAGLALTAVVLIAAVLAFARIGSAAGFDAHQSDALAYVGGLLGGRWPLLLGVTVLVSLAASLQTTLVYLSRSVLAMGRDRVLPGALGRLDQREEPAAAIVLITVLSVVFCLAAEFVPNVADAFAVALQGTSWFLGVLFAMSAAAAVQLFWDDPARRWSGVIVPGLAAAGLAAVLAVGLMNEPFAPRVFIGVSAIIGLPLAIWRGRTARRLPKTRESSILGSRF
ncbi:MAG TPA: APC family permease [Candidatus Elarobacter sp.]